MPKKKKIMASSMGDSPPPPLLNFLCPTIQTCLANIILRKN